jgi:hypothetical protein
MLWMGIWVHPYAYVVFHPQHLKVLKHFVYIQYMWDAANGGLQPQP